MPKHKSVSLVPHLAKSIHVELADKTAHVGVLEMGRQDPLLEVSDVRNLKLGPLLYPVDRVDVSLVLRRFTDTSMILCVNWIKFDIFLDCLTMKRLFLFFDNYMGSQ